MRTLVVYKSYLGATKHYAEWLEEALTADMMKFADVTDALIDAYDTVIVTSGTYAGNMPLVGFLQKHWEALQHKNVVVMAVGIAPAEDKESKKAYEKIPFNIRERITYFKVPGKLFGIKPSGEPSREKLEPVISYVNTLLH